MMNKTISNGHAKDIKVNTEIICGGVVERKRKMQRDV